MFSYGLFEIGHVYSKRHILSEIRRTALGNGGVPLGVQRFLIDTGIKDSDWHGRFWARQGDALKEAGHQPNQFNAARTDEDLLSNLAALVGELGRFPVKGEIQLKARSDPQFPSHNTFRRSGGKQEFAFRLEKFCLDRGDIDVAELVAWPPKGKILKTKRQFPAGRSLTT